MQQAEVIKTNQNIRDEQRETQQQVIYNLLTHELVQT